MFYKPDHGLLSNDLKDCILSYEWAIPEINDTPPKEDMPFFAFKNMNSQASNCT